MIFNSTKSGRKSLFWATKQQYRLTKTKKGKTQLISQITYCLNYSILLKLSAFPSVGYIRDNTFIHDQKYFFRRFRDFNVYTIVPYVIQIVYLVLAQLLSGP